MKIAISIRANLRIEELLTNNGIMQNAKFFYDLLKAMGHDVYFLYFNADLEESFSIADQDYEAKKFSDVIDQKVKTDILLEIGVTLPPSHRESMRSHTGAKIVVVRLGNSYVLDLEVILNKRDDKRTIYYRGADRVWLSPHYESTIQYHQAINGCPVSIAPYLWEPDFVKNDFSGGTELERPHRIYVMEPNFSAVKNALIPLCIVSKLYEQNPDSFDHAMILNSMHIRNNKFFLNNVVRNLPGLSSKEKKVFYGGRYTFEEVFKQPDVLLSFHRENSLNYLTNEALYKGVPIVHNAEEMSDVGYYYPDYDIQTAVEATLLAMEKGYCAETREVSREFLKQFSVRNADVQETYAGLLDLVCSPS